MSDAHEMHDAAVHDGHAAAEAPAAAHPTQQELAERKVLTRQELDPSRDLMTVSMGPQHPSMHGVYRAVLDLDGEIIADVRPEIGNLHRGLEKLCEHRTYHQIVPLTDRLDYISAFAMNHGFCEAAEKLMGIEVPPRARYIRTIADELARISNHILWLGVHIMDRTKAQVAKDLPDGFEHRCRKVMEFLPKRVAEYERIIKHNRIYYKRAKGVGVFTAADCYAWRVTGPPLRSAGVARDLRKDEPYAAYDEVDFEVAVEYNADVYDRFLVRMKEIRESCKIVLQCLDNLPDGDYIARDAGHVLPRKSDVLRQSAAMIQDFEQVFRGPQTPKGEVYRAIEVPKGEMGVYIRSEGGGKPARVRFATPSFYHGQAVPPLVRGEMIADMVAIFASIDVVLGDCDR